eukprot:3891182-Amphidinium_carterae.1
MHNDCQSIVRVRILAIVSKTLSDWKIQLSPAPSHGQHNKSASSVLVLRTSRQFLRSSAPAFLLCKLSPF